MVGQFWAIGLVSELFGRVERCFIRLIECRGIGYRDIPSSRPLLLRAITRYMQLSCVIDLLRMPTAWQMHVAKNLGTKQELRLV